MRALAPGDGLGRIYGIRTVMLKKVIAVPWVHVHTIIARRHDDKHRIVRTQVQMFHVLKRILLQSTSDSDPLQNVQIPPM